MTKKALELFIISDAIGETAQKVITAVLAQFPDLTTVETKRFSFIDSKEELLRILQDAHTVQAIVISTMVDTELNQLAQQLRKKFFRKFEKNRKENSVYYGGKFLIEKEYIKMESFYPSREGKTNWYIKEISTGIIQNDTIRITIFDIEHIYVKKSMGRCF